MRICLTGPIATADVAHLLYEGGSGLPGGYSGAPLTAVLVEELLRLGHEVVAISTDSSLNLDHPLPRLARGARFEFQLCPARPRAWRPNGWRFGRAIDLFSLERAGLRQAIADSGAELVHAHWTYEFAWAALDSGLPCLITCHDSPAAVLRFARNPYRALRYLMARQVLRRAEHLTAVSNYMASQASELARAQVSVIPNPVARHVFDVGHARAASASRRLAMVCNGWGRRKNPKPALAAFAAFRKQVPQAMLHCFGADFGEGQTAHHWVQQRGIAQGIAFHGIQPHRTLISQLATMDALLHPAKEESFGVVVAEAMALGLPLVAGLRSGAVSWVVNDGLPTNTISPGVLTDVDSSDALLQALHECFDSRYPDRSASGMALAKSRFSAEAVIASYLRAYQALLQSQPAGALRGIASRVPVR